MAIGTIVGIQDLLQEGTIQDLIIGQVIDTFQEEIHSLEEDHMLITKELIGFHEKEGIMQIEFLAVIICIDQTVGIDNIKGES